MTISTGRTARTLLPALAGLLFLSGGRPQAGPGADEILRSFGRESGLFVVIGCGEGQAPEMAVALGRNGNALVHAIAGSEEELARFNRAIAGAGVKGGVTAERLALSPLPYRDFLVNVMVVMDVRKAAEAGLDLADARRCLAPYGRLVTCAKGKIERIEEIPLPEAMDAWTHRYHAADGIPMSRDRIFDLPVGFRWNAGLPMNFDNPKQSANRYSSTRAMVVDDGRCFTFSTVVYENLGDGWRSAYGTDQYLTCRDAFNGRLLWRRKIGDTFYGGLYIENMAPLVSTGTRLYLAGADGNMLVVSTRTGETVRELPTAHIPGVIAAADGVVVAATWKGGKVMGSIERYDRRRMDWEIGEGTLEAYDDASGRPLWKNGLLGTSMVIADGRVFVVNRSEADPLEKNHNKEDGRLRHPPQKVIALDLARGTVLWEAIDESFEGAAQTMTLEAAGHGAVAVAHRDRNNVTLLSGETGRPLEADAAKEAGQNFFRFRGHICTPVMRVNEVILNNRGGSISKPGLNVRFGGARAACLTGTIPAYGSGYIAQNWCRCSPGQIDGLLAIGPIGKEPAPAEMETPAEPVALGTYSEGEDAAEGSSWTAFRANAERSSSSACDIPEKIGVAWTRKVVSAELKDGTLRRDWREYLNGRLTAPVISGGRAIVGDMDHNELIAVDLEGGSVAWRFMTAGRMDTAPTLHGGLCLAGDHTGYVTAVKIRNGEPVYRLRVAPQEKRMLSHGKVESVWPVIGGVMVSGGRAYASTGRTQGSDGGIVVRAFVPETGRPIWARAIPQSGNGVTEPQTRRNDTLVRHKDLALLMGHRLDLGTGKLVRDPALAFQAGAKAEAEKELGRRMNRDEEKAFLKKLAPELSRLEREDRKVATGLEGLHSWNWTRLGHRKFMDIGYGEFRGDTVSWTNDRVAACDRNNNLTLSWLEKSAGGPAAPSGGARRSFRVADDRQVTSLVLCNNVVVLGGAVLDGGSEKGFIQAIRLEDAAPVWDRTFPSKLSFNGLAVDRGRIVAAFHDGTVACLE